MKLSAPLTWAVEVSEENHLGINYVNVFTYCRRCQKCSQISPLLTLPYRGMAPATYVIMPTFLTGQDNLPRPQTIGSFMSLDLADGMLYTLDTSNGLKQACALGFAHLHLCHPSPWEGQIWPSLRVPGGRWQIGAAELQSCNQGQWRASPSLRFMSPAKTGRAA